MDGVTLLRRARDAGLRVGARGDTLRIKGPRKAEALALELITRKREVVALLRAGTLWRQLGELERTKSNWFQELRDCREQLEACGDLVLEYARSRWGEEAEGWPSPMLAGMYARDLLAGLQAVLGPSDGWERIRSKLDAPGGPRVFAGLWGIYAELADELRRQVMELGDRSQSPPEAQRRWLSDA